MICQEVGWEHQRGQQSLGENSIKFYNTPLVGLRIQARLSATSKASSEVKITLPFIRTILAIFLVILGP